MKIKVKHNIEDGGKGGTCIVGACVSGVFYIGVARCSRLDQYSRRIGREIACSRMGMAMLIASNSTDGKKCFIVSPDLQDKKDQDKIKKAVTKWIKYIKEGTRVAEHKG